MPVTTRPSSRRLPLTSIHATNPGIKSCLSLKRQHGSALFEHSMGATLGSHQNCPLTSIPNLPTWMVPLGGSISNKCYLSFDKQALETYKSHNNVGRITPTYDDGTKVLVYFPVRRRGLNESLMHRWIGPFTVVRAIKSTTYLLRRDSNGRFTSAHVARIKPYLTPSPFSSARPFPMS